LSDALNLTSSNFQTEVLQSRQPVLVDFWAPWCMPCKMIAPIVEKVATTYAGRLKVAKLNTDDEPSLSAQYDVTGIPCLILYKAGEPVDRIVGYVPERHLIAMVEKHLAPVA
jgi:thioredoxin 1